MGKKLGAYSLAFLVTLFLCGAYMGGWIGFFSTHQADFTLSTRILVASGAAVLLAFVAAYMGLMIFGSNIISNERQARIVVLSIWGTITIIALIGIILEFIVKTEDIILTFGAPGVFLGLILGAEIAAAVYGSVGPKKCSDHAA